MNELEAAAEAIHAGELVVYPTETVYGLGADALDPTAIELAFEAKGRPRDEPMALAVPDVTSALGYVQAGERALACMEAFLPGPVTVVCECGPRIPQALTGGRDRVGVRVPAHDVAKALLEFAAPITATSANPSGGEPVTRVADLDPTLRERVSAVIDGGETPGGASTVVDPERGIVHRRGALAGAVEAWLRSY